MVPIIKLLGVSTCCLVGATAAAAEPLALDDAELDWVAAGDSRPGIWAFPIPPRTPFSPVELPNGPIPVEGPGCNTGGGPCDPSPPPLPIVGPGGFPFIGPFPGIFGPLGFGGGCVGGPAATCPSALGAG